MGVLGRRDVPTSDGTVRPQVLLADDDAPTRALMVGLLRYMGWVTDGVANGREAVEAVRGGGYGIVLLDLHMPEMDGYEAARWIRALGPDLRQPRVIALTGQRDPGIREKCLAAGMQDLLLKPVAQEALRQALERAPDPPDGGRKRGWIWESGVAEGAAGS